MTDEYRALERKYVFDVDSMTTEELVDFHDILTANYDAPFRERRIMTIERRLSSIRRAQDAKDARERVWKTAGYEYVDLTKRWLSLGATHRMLYDIYTVWELDGEEFFRWQGGEMIVDIIVRARKADEELDEIIKRK